MRANASFVGKVWARPVWGSKVLWGGPGVTMICRCASRMINKFVSNSTEDCVTRLMLTLNSYMPLITEARFRDPVLHSDSGKICFFFPAKQT